MNLYFARLNRLNLRFKLLKFCKFPILRKKSEKIEKGENL